VINRKPHNQPKGYVPKQHYNIHTTHHYCYRHNYTYYPASWVDSNGNGYNSGYYDEDGNYYKDVVFKKDGKYNNVTCYCPYCGSQTVLSFDEKQTVLECPNCGGQMEIQSAIDEYTQDPSYTEYQKHKKSTGKVVLFILFIMYFPALISCFVGIFNVGRSVKNAVNNSNTNIVSNTDTYGNVIYLDYIGDNTYAISDDGNKSYDKVIYWNSNYDSYYDVETDCYIWNNTDVSPSVWQYWYEGVSSNYGDYGWMEYDSGSWWIEESDSNWESYEEIDGENKLWHIEE
jgi:DNA-directed RNA polymerase subunit M/transcription elongation factor TFIIS